MIILLFLQALFGIVSPLNKQALLLCHPLFFTAGKLLCAGFVLCGVQLLRHQSFPSILQGQWWLYAQIMVLGNFCAHFLKYWGLQHVQVTKLALIFNTAPFFVALFEYVRFSKTITKKQLLGLLISFSGLIPILMTTSPAEQVLGEWFFMSWPECAIFAAVALHAWSLTSKKILLRAHNYWPVAINGVCMLGGGLLSIMYAYVIQIPLPCQKVPAVVGYILLTTIISKVFCSTLSMHLMKYYSPTLLAFTDYWYVLFVALWSWGLWGEVLTRHFWLSAAIVFCGQYFFYSDELR